MAALDNGAGFRKSIFGVRVSRATAALPQTTQSALFNIVGGRVLLTGILGEVTTVIQNQANNTKLVANPTAGSDVDLCAVTDVANLEVGGKLTAVAGPVAAPFGIALVKTLAGASPFGFGTHAIALAVGTLDLSCAASNTGSVKWELTYVPLDNGATITAA